jgi:hypothetical protein
MQDRHGFKLTENLKKQRMRARGIGKAMVGSQQEEPEVSKQDVKNHQEEVS